MFQKLLIANRGEIACRIIRTARAMGIKTVAVHSEADRRALHVELADESVCIGPPPARESYLSIDRILDACRQTGAQAVHPGYGFLSENAMFARRIEAAGVVFIGPGPRAIFTMGNKIAARRLAREVGVNIVPGFDEPLASREQAVEAARAVGYPVMIKAAAGGGGRGLRVARDDSEAADAFDVCRAEALGAFGDDRVFAEKFIERPRHIEIQVLADSHGNSVYLWERECSIQRRHQKVIEEAPCPFLDEPTRQAMGAQALSLARAVDYTSAGTVEFIVDSQRQFYFMEMNTRLQVEYPVTERITGLNLVELMIRIAAGERLPFLQAEVRRNGCAIECRINAEDPARGFLPSTGRLVRFLPPPEAEDGVRVDTGVYEGDEIAPFYDSMIAKVITHGESRAEAIERMQRALDVFVIRGPASNLGFQSALLRHPKFLSAELHTGFIAEEFAGGYNPSSCSRARSVLLASVAAYARRRYIERAVATTGQLEGHPRTVERDWVVLMNGQEYPLSVDLSEAGGELTDGDRKHALRTGWRLGEPVLRGTWDGHPIGVQVERQGLKYRLSHGGSEAEALVMTARAAALLALMPRKATPDLSRFLLSPMPGLLLELAVEAGQAVHVGQTLAVIEAMKMRNVLRAETEGTVAELMASPGDSLTVDQPILRFA